MRKLIFWTLLGLCFGGATVAFGLTKQECIDIKAVYGWTPDGCTTSTSETAVSKPASKAPSTLEPTNAPTPEQVESHIFFPKGGSALDATALAQVKALAQILNGEVLGNACLALVGHSDASGGKVTNMSVSQARAEAVGAALREQLVLPQKLERVVAVGETMPLENLSDRSKWQRRVEIRARDCDLSM